MGDYRPIKVSCWIAFLKSLGCSKAKGQAKGSHEKWKCPGCIKSIIFRPAKKDIPAFHIFTNLKTMGIDRKVFLTWVKENCK